MEEAQTCETGLQSNGLKCTRTSKLKGKLKANSCLQKAIFIKYKSIADAYYYLAKKEDVMVNLRYVVHQDKLFKRHILLCLP